MAQEKIAAPQSSTGLMRFYDVNASKIQVDPRVIVGATLAIILVVLLAQML
jgi:preprotein translocase subunit Sec61beta